jgi:truncated hemoglobin YjbI
MSMKAHCPSCEAVCSKPHDLSQHPSLITVLAKEKREGEMLYVFFCKDCSTLLSMNLSMENPMDDDISFLKEEMSDEFIEHFSLALWAESRRDQVQQRIDFLKERLIPIYEAIDEDEYEKIKESNDATVVRTPYFPQWYDNIEDALNSFDEEDEWDESFIFSYAEPIDHHMVSSSNHFNRFFRTYLVPANEIEAMLRIETNEPNRLSIWKQTVSRIERVSIWDEREGKNLSVDDFIQNTSKEDLCMEVSEHPKDSLLNPYKKWINEKYTSYIVS